MRKMFILGMAVAAGMTFAASKAMATDVPVTPLKLIIVDKLVASSSAKAVFVVKDLAVTKGTSTNTSTAIINSQLDVSYDAEDGSFVNASGANWLVNKSTVAKYVNKNAPAGGSTKVSVIKPGKLIKNVGKSLGDTPIDISTAPVGNVLAVYTVVNDGQTNRHCGQFTGTTCAHKSIAGATGWKLVCKGNGSPASCPASPSGAFID
jgi:hypothetical protein